MRDKQGITPGYTSRDVKEAGNNTWVCLSGCEKEEITPGVYLSGCERSGNNTRVCLRRRENKRE